ncbi:hypothetical protein H6P81_021150 [Aristolochia fimbriata]|uniref:Uncharacterized protein n=1 Tax=Aristolochia fimbriata TaxID=158543 RepID=A0AAV7DU78_ARIFI|nr:hypothetical protein H6P81_021150 [Aristolochia fimbriata]
MTGESEHASRTRYRRLGTRRGSVVSAVSAVAGPSPSAETALFLRKSTILDWPPSHDLERKRGPCYYKASKLLPQDTVALPWGRGCPDFHRLACSVWSAPWFLECQPQRGMPSTRALLATNHSLAGRSGSAFQVRYPNRLLCSTGSLAPSSILSTALLLGSLLLQPLAVIACFSGCSHPGWCG